MYLELILWPELEFEKVRIEDFNATAMQIRFGHDGFYKDAYDKCIYNLIREFDLE